jgi:uncharacterized Tic20 family protein
LIDQDNAEEINVGPITVFDQDGRPLIEHDPEALKWGMICHLSALIGLLGIPFGQVVGPLIVWYFRKKAYPFVDDQGKEAMNFQISMTIYGLAAGMLTVILVGWMLIGVLVLFNLAQIVIAALKVKKGEAYRYPFSLRLIKL